MAMRMIDNIIRSASLSHGTPTREPPERVSTSVPDVPNRATVSREPATESRATTNNPVAEASRHH